MAVQTNPVATKEVSTTPQNVLKNDRLNQTSMALETSNVWRKTTLQYKKSRNLGSSETLKSYPNQIAINFTNLNSKGGKYDVENALQAMRAIAQSPRRSEEGNIGEVTEDSQNTTPLLQSASQTRSPGFGTYAFSQIKPQVSGDTYYKSPHWNQTLSTNRVQEDTNQEIVRLSQETRIVKAPNQDLIQEGMA